MCISCLQDLLKNKEKKSEPEKAQQDTVVATEHLPKENMIIAMLNSLRIQLELHMKNILYIEKEEKKCLLYIRTYPALTMS